MAYPRTRSVNTELHQGSIDGTYKQAVKDRGGEVEHTTNAARADLNCKNYDIHESPVMETPDGRSFISPYHTDAHVCPDTQHGWH